MITLEEWMKLVGHRVTDASQYGWTCYGPYAFRFESWSGTQEGYSLEIIFDILSNVTYEITLNDMKRNKAYRMLNPDTLKIHKEECIRRGVSDNEAWDDVEYIDLEVVNDFLEKARAVVAGEDYDPRIQVELNLPKDELFELMKLAHEKDITFNDFVVEVVEKCCKEELEKLKIEK